LYMRRRGSRLAWHSIPLSQDFVSNAKWCTRRKIANRI
jgi:hypothetical protein